MLPTLLASPAARATTFTWTGLSNNVWSNVVNWSGLSAPPTSGLGTSDLVFGSTTRTAPSLGGSAYSINSLTFPDGAASYTFGSGSLTIGSGGLAQNGTAGQTFNLPVTLGSNSNWNWGANGSGIVSFSQGLSLGSFLLQFTANGNHSIASVLSGTGKLTKLGAGSLTLTGTNTYTGLTQVDAGTLVISGGGLGGGSLRVNAGGLLVVTGNASLPSNPDDFALFDGTLSSPATVNVLSGTLDLNGGLIGDLGFAVLNQSGGTVLSTTNAFSQIIGQQAGSTGIYNLSGGSYAGAQLFAIGVSGVGIVNQSGGRLANDSIQMGVASAGRGTYNLDGGTLACRSLTTTGGTGIFNFNGGILQFTSISSTFAPSTANVRAGGAVIDTNGQVIGISQPLLHSTLVGDPATDGGLTKIGSGLLTLTGANTFTGGVTVKAGTLKAANASFFGPGPITLAGGALLFTDGSVNLTGRTINLGSSGVLEPSSAGGSLIYLSSNVSGGMLGAGSHQLNGGVNLTSTRTAFGAALSLTNGATFQNVTLGGNSTLSQSGGTLTSTGEFIATPLTTMNLAGAVSVAGAYLSGQVTVLSGGSLGTTGSAPPLYLDGSRGVTVSSGGQLAAGSGSSIELGGLLINNGTQTGLLNVNLGGVVQGNGTFGTVHLAATSSFSAAGTIGGMLTVDSGASVALSGTGKTLTVAGPLVNNGLMRFDHGAALQVTSGAGNFVNTGVIDVISGSATLPAGFVNQGIILDRSVVKVKSIARDPGGASVSVQIDGYPGHTYQLQRTTSLTAGFTNLASVPPQSGPASGAAATLTFQDPNPPSGESFYRVQVDG